MLPVRARTARLFVLALSCLALGACGGGDSGGGSSTQAAETRDPREGYFHDTESKALNPPLARYQAAWTAYTENAEACDKRAQRLYAGGASPRKSVQCHLRANQALLDSTIAVRTAVRELDGSYRTQCDAQIGAFANTLDQLEEARQRVLDDWNAYATSGNAPRSTQRDITAADELSQEFLDEAVQKLSAPCYTEADLAEAESE